tara:strand:- start:6506 stop:9673 length:3168 start_codon:yes stop_codon:yes gene_type:complete
LKNQKHIIKTNLNAVKRIYHISDIQIRNLHRHSEFEDVFNKLYEIIKKNPEDSVVYIGGDIAHSKTEMSPELVDQLSRLFKNLSDIVPTIIIAGNHDCNLNNTHRLDVLTPIVENLNHPNLYYFKDSGVYNFADITFVVWDVWDTEENYIQAKDVEGDTKVLLYHGTVDQSATDLGFKLPSKVKLESMDGYDMVLLGDIHKMQTLQEYDNVNKKPHVRYCGSLVQQNYGEAVYGHGVSVWDVKNRKFEHIEIPNDYGYATLDIIDGNLPKDWDALPEKGRLRLRCKNTTETQIKKVLSIVKDKYPKLTESKLYKVDSVINLGDEAKKISIGDVSNVDYQNKLILDYIKKEFFIDDNLEIQLQEINNELNQILPEEDIQRNINWKIKKFEFDNMFSYGKTNIVDFTRLSGIIGIFAPNASGKSSLLDALSFCLFDTCSRAFKADMILNNKKSDFRCKLNIEIDGTDYYVERKGKRLLNGHVKVDVNFERWDTELQQMVSMNGDQRRTTNNNIRRVLGTYDDFILTTLSTQNNSSGVFIDKTQKEKKELLAQFMGIGVFDKLYQMASERVKEESVLLKNFQQSNYEDELTEARSQLKSNKIDLKLIDEKLSEYEEQKEKFEESKKEFTSKLKPIEDVKDIEKLKEELNILKDETGILRDQYISLEKSIVNTKELLDTLKNKKIKKLDIEEVGNKKRDLENYEKLLLTLENQIDVEQKAIDKLQSWEWNETCEACLTNPFVKDAKNAIDTITHNKHLQTQYIKEAGDLRKVVKEYTEIQSKYDIITKSIFEEEAKLESVHHQKDVIIEKGKNVKQSKQYVLKDITKFERQEKSIKFNKDILSKIELVESEIQVVDSKIKDHTAKKYNRGKTVAILETQIKTLFDNITKMEELEDTIGAYHYYLQAVSRDGVPYNLIQDALPTIEGEVNNILSQIVDFSIIFKMDGKSINNYIVYDEDNVWLLELSSGMEKFISSLALRVGLINVCNLPRGNFLAIDEGFGTMDSENLNSVYSFFQYLKSQFQFVVIVSHIESMRDAVDTLLEIKKEHGYSNISFGKSS